MAQRAQLLSLARADPVAAVPGATVAAIEITHNGATYHFVIDATPEKRGHDELQTMSQRRAHYSSRCGAESVRARAERTSPGTLWLAVARHSMCE